MPFSHSPISFAVAMALACTTLQAAEQFNLNEQDIAQLAPVVLQANPSFVVGKTQYSKQDLENTPNTQKTITDFLKVNPNVQFSNEALAAGKSGELSAADVSINGALFYDNKFLLNNVNIGNALNPAEGQNDTAIDSIGGRSLSATVNTDLLCGLEVLDSNVSAEYGEFAGGVVKAKTCASQTEVGKIHGSLSYDFTSSDWSKYHFIDDDEFELFADNNDASYQKAFNKQGISSSIYGKANEQLGLSLSASRRWSDIDLNAKHSAQENTSQTRQADNIAANIYYDLNENNQLKVGMYYQTEDNKKNNPSLANSSFQSQSENLALDVEFVHDFDLAKLTQNLVLQSQKNARDAQSTEMLVWNTSPDKDWGTATLASEGGYGDLETSQKNWQYNLKSEFKAFEWVGIQHQIKAGAGYAHYAADWQRLDDAYMYYMPSKANGGLGTSSCTLANGSIDPHCDLSYSNGDVSGQYLARRKHYQQGQIELQQDRWHAFIEDEMNWNNQVKLRLGLRQDYDSLSKKNTLAPRSNIQFMPFADDRLSLTVGWNRYYANNAFAYDLQDGKNALSVEERRNSILQDWKISTSSTSANTVRSQLEVPYSDEMVFALGGVLGNWRSQLKFVDRENKDQVRKDKIDTTSLDYIYTNHGKSVAKTYTFQLDNLQPIQWFNSKNRFSLAADYSEIERNFNHYDDSMYNEDVYIEYDGKVIANIEKPADNFARPWTIRAMWDIKFDHLPVTFSNFLRYRSAYDVMNKSSIAKADRYEYQGEIVKNRFDPEHLAAAFSWDTRASYALKLGRDYDLNLGLTVNNVFDRHNKYYDSAKSRILSEIGRQFVADITLKF